MTNNFLRFLVANSHYRATGTVVDLKLQNHTNEEIARRMQFSERTVRRMIKRVEQNFEKLIREDDQSSG